MKSKLFLIAAALMFYVVSIYPHHSLGATYQADVEIKLEGKLVQFVFRNPHSYVTIQAPDAKGAMQRWSVEWAGTSQLSNRGITQETLKINDAIVIVGRPSRVTGEYRLLMVNLTRPSDGFQWGTSTGDRVE